MRADLATAARAAREAERIEHARSTHGDRPATEPDARAFEPEADVGALGEARHAATLAAHRQAQRAAERRRRARLRTPVVTRRLEDLSPAECRRLGIKTTDTEETSS